MTPARKRALLAEALRRKTQAPQAFPLSFGQQRLWFLDKFSPGEPVYSIPLALRLVGPLDVDAIRAGLDAVVARHASLRTTFPDQGGEPVQVVAPSGTAELRLVDLPTPAADRERVASRFADEQAMIGFDLRGGPLFRAALARLGDDDHVLFLNLHHIISDAWSLTVLLDELTEVYVARHEGREPSLPELPLQYPDFAAWQRDRMSSATAQAQVDHFRRQLDGAPALLTLPTDRPRPAAQTTTGALHTTMLPASFAADLETMARAQGATLFMTLLGAFTALLGGLAGQDDVVVGTPVAGRSDARLEHLIGFFVNTVPMRMTLAGDPTFADLLDRAREVTIGALANADVPFERLVEELAPQRSLQYPPVFQAQLILQNSPATPVALPGLDVRGILPDPGVSKFDITLSAELVRSGFMIAIEYNTDLFDVETIEAFADRLVALLTAATHDPRRRVAELAPLSGLQRWQVVVGDNDTELRLPDVATAVDLVPATGGTAVVGADTTAAGLDFATLHERSDRLAAVLAAAGVGPDVPVALCVDRSAAMVTAILAVWKAGGCYVPLDPSWPAERLRLMIDDAAPPVLLTSAAVDRPDVVDAFAGTVVDVATALDESLPAARPAVAVTGEHLAYVIYTSGSTGRPKGVAVPHRAVVNLLASFGDVLAMEPGDRLAAVTTLSFDISVLELLAPLVAGATTHVVPADTVADGSALRELLAGSGATHLQATPATWRVLQAAGGVPVTTQVRLCGGEALPRDLADELLGDDGLLWNVYGPTETTVWSAAGLVAPSPEPVLIGPPIGNTGLYVLDRAMEPVPVGVVGELFIGGTGVVRGYHGRPRLTAERFVPDPFSSRPGARLYATGDLARRRRDGLLEFLGRADHQVKVRGFRIELGEIEAALLADDRVREAVVTTWHGATADDVRLVAHVAADDTPGLWPELRAAIATTLPDYMVPAACVVLDALPVSPSGKLDRAALPDPTWGDAGETVAPRDAVEEVLAGIWREVLGDVTVGAHDDFFALGGHSLLAAKALARVRAAFALDVPIRRFFQSPTVAGVAAVLRELEDVPGTVSTIAELRREVETMSADSVRSMLGES